MLTELEIDDELFCAARGDSLLGNEEIVTKALRELIESVTSRNTTQSDPAAEKD